MIRQELATPSPKERRRRRPSGLTGPEEEIELAELCERAGITRETARELEEYGLISARVEGSAKHYPESDVDVAIVCERLGKFGASPRHLRAFRTSADREAGLLEAIVAPALRARNLERRQAGLEDLQSLAELAQDLAQLLFWRDLRRLAAS